MGFDKGRHAATGNQPRTTNQRREHLETLKPAIEVRPELTCRIVERAGTATLSVVTDGVPPRAIEIGCDFTEGTWWFTWADDGQTIATVDDIDGTTHVIVRELSGART